MNIKAVKYIGRGFALGVAAILAFYYYVFTQVCANTVITEALSPGRAWKAVLFERGCGSFTGNSTQISLVRPDEALRNDAGNVYVAEDGAAGYGVEWLADDLVRVSGIRGANHLRLEEYDGVRIQYQASGRGAP